MMPESSGGEWIGVIEAASCSVFETARCASWSTEENWLLWSKRRVRGLDGERSAYLWRR
jgi:hypothetical protein